MEENEFGFFLMKDKKSYIALNREQQRSFGQ